MIRDYFFHKKAIYRVISAAMGLLMAGLIYAAYLNEGMTGYDLPLAVAAALGILFLVMKVFPGKNAFGGRRAVRVIVNVLTVLGTPFAAMMLLQNFTLDPLRIYPLMMLANAVFYYLAYLLLSFLFGSFRAGYIVADVIFAIIGVGNYFIVQFRGSPIVPWDLFSIRTAASVAGNYTYDISWRFVFTLFGFLALIALDLKNTIKCSVAVRIIGVILCTAGLAAATWALQRSDVKSKLGMDVTLFTPNVRYRNNGFLAAFLGNLHLINVQEPSGYSVNAVKQIQREIHDATAGSDGQNSLQAAQQMVSEGRMPNVVVIMDEAFSDLQVLGRFNTDEDYMPNFRKLMGQCGGHLMVSVKGGNTANTEFEFLAGDTMAFLPAGSVVFQQFIRDNIPALPSYLASLGYETTGIHPYLSTGWDRKRVYPLLGFEEFLSKEAFSGAKTLRDWISDEAAFDKIKEVLEQKKDEGITDPQFIFEVTMQNHSGYSPEYPGFTERIHLTDLTYSTVQTKAAEKYLTLIKYTDEALGDLMTYFESISEPTIVVMFGDHQPSDYVTNVIDHLTGYDPEVSLEEAQKSYIVPYFVWNNFGMNFNAPTMTSVNYLAVDILQAAGIPLTQYQQFLLALQPQLPVVCQGTLIDAAGNYYSTDEIKESPYAQILNTYNILQYNHMNDIRNRVTSVFAKPAGDAAGEME